jgi:hypothetical protein
MTYIHKHMYQNIDNCVYIYIYVCVLMICGSHCTGSLLEIVSHEYEVLHEHKDVLNEWIPLFAVNAFINDPVGMKCSI